MSVVFQSVYKTCRLQIRKNNQGRWHVLNFRVDKIRTCFSFSFCAMKCLANHFSLEKENEQRTPEAFVNIKANNVRKQIVHPSMLTASFHLEANLWWLHKVCFQARVQNNSALPSVTISFWNEVGRIHLHLCLFCLLPSHSIWSVQFPHENARREERAVWIQQIRG